MNKIIDSSELSVTKLKKSIKFNIKTTTNVTFYNSIKHILNIQNKEKTFSIEGTDIVCLYDKLKSKNLNFKNYENLFLHLKKQINFLVNKGIGLYSLDSRDIYYIETKKNKDSYLSEHFFVILKLNNYEKIKDGFMNISKPIKFSEFHFISPELKKRKTFPFKINFNTVYYSLGLLIYFCITGKKEKDIKKQKKELESIAETSLYWSLLRSLEINSENRSLLYI